MYSPPFTRGTARSTKTRPGSCRRRLFTSGPSVFESPWLSPPRSANSAKRRLPAWPTSPDPSALTRSRGRSLNFPLQVMPSQLG